MGHRLASHPLTSSGSPPLPCQDISDGIVQLCQPNMASVWELLLVQDEWQGAVCYLHFQPFSVKAKPCNCSATSATVFVRPTHADIAVQWYGMLSALLHGLSDGLQCVALHAARIAPMDWGVEVLVIISCLSENDIPSKETVGTRLRPCPARWLHR